MGYVWEVGEALLGHSLCWAGIYLPTEGDGPYARMMTATGARAISPSRFVALPAAFKQIMALPPRPCLLDADTAQQLEDVEASTESVVPMAAAWMALPLRRKLPAAKGLLLLGLSERPEAWKRTPVEAGLRRLLVGLARAWPRVESSELQTRSHHALLGLVTLASQFGSYHQAPQITEKALDYLQTELGFTQALLTMLDDTGRTLFGVDARGYEDICRIIRSSRDAAEPDMFAVALQSGQPLFVSGSSVDDPRIPVFMRNRVPEEMLLLPMRVENQPVGVLLAEYPPAMRPLHDDRLGLYQHVADIVGQALYTASLYEKMRRTAETDPLTGCFNRLALNVILDEEIPRVKRHNKPLSLLMVDLCDFKKFNDLYSHIVGDRILKTVARLLQECTRKTDKVVRYGGDEFLVLMPNTNEVQARAVVERIESAVRDNNEAAKSEQEIFLLSLGLKSATRDNVDRLLEDADEAMYRRKAEQSRAKLFNAFTSNNPDDLKKSDSFVAVLIKNLTQREPHFLDHARHVMLNAQALCQRIGADEAMMERVSLAALLHDIGKIALPVGLLTKITPLTPDDRRQIRMHPTAGSDFLAGHKYLSDLRIVINHHHERWDGITTGPSPGYPSGLAGEQIPLEARIIRIVETYDELVSPRPWRPVPFTPQRAIEVLRSEAGHSLDPQLVHVFADYLEMIYTPLSDFSPGKLNDTRW